MGKHTFLGERGRLAGSIYSSLRALYEPPFFFGDEEIDSCIELVAEVDKIVARNARKLAKESGVEPSKAHELLIHRRRVFPEIGKTLELPRIEDIAAAVRSWMLYVEDEEEDRTEVTRIFGEEGVRISTVAEEKEFSNLLESRPFMEYWIDLGLGARGDTRVGARLITKVRDAQIDDKLEGNVIVYTQHASARSLQRTQVKEVITEVIDKSDDGVEELIRAHAARLRKLLKETLGLNPAHPLIQLAWEQHAAAAAP